MTRGNPFSIGVDFGEILAPFKHFLLFGTLPDVFIVVSVYEINLLTINHGTQSCGAVPTHAEITQKEKSVIRIDAFIDILN
jgi:hypothetical protein